MASLNSMRAQSVNQPIPQPVKQCAVQPRIVTIVERSKSLPIVDLSGLSDRNPRVQKMTANRIGEIAEFNGFLYLDKHGVQSELLDKVYDQSRRFFSQSTEVKNQHYIGNSDNHRGYVPTTETGEYVDEGPRRYEAFDMGFDSPVGKHDPLKGIPLVGPNVWPELDGFKSTLSMYYSEMRRVEQLMCQAFETSLGIEPGFFQKRMTRPVSQLRLIHYLQNNDASSSGTVNMGAHTDYECFTILHSKNPGLQILDMDDNWIDAPPIEGTFYFNIGDMLEAWSNGKFVATPHRVQNNGNERYSIPYFAAPDFDTVIEPMTSSHNRKINLDKEYQPFVAGEHLLTQLLRDFQYLNKRHNTGELNFPKIAPSENPFENRIRQSAGMH